MAKPIDFAGQRFGRWTILDRAAGRGADDSFLWNARHDCGLGRVVSSTQLATCRSKNCQPRCDACTGLSSGARCGLCRKTGHITALCPQKKRRSGVCVLCADLPHRVTGPRCKLCRLPYEDEPREEIDYGARQASNLARAMVNS